MFNRWNNSWDIFSFKGIKSVHNIKMKKYERVVICHSCLRKFKTNDKKKRYTCGKNGCCRKWVRIRLKLEKNGMTKEEWLVL